MQLPIGNVPRVPPTRLFSGPLGVTGGKTPSEYMFSELPLIADVVASQPRDCLQPHFGVENVCGCPPSGTSELTSLTGPGLNSGRPATSPFAEGADGWDGADAPNPSAISRARCPSERVAHELEPAMGCSRRLQPRGRIRTVFEPCLRTPMPIPLPAASSGSYRELAGTPAEA